MITVEKALTGSDLGFAAVVALTTVATLMPRLIAGVGPADRSFGPFTPGLEKILGRVAMMGKWPDAFLFCFLVSSFFMAGSSHVSGLVAILLTIVNCNPCEWCGMSGMECSNVHLWTSSHPPRQVFFSSAQLLNIKFPLSQNKERS